MQLLQNMYITYINLYKRLEVTHEMYHCRVRPELLFTTHFTFYGHVSLS